MSKMNLWQGFVLASLNCALCFGQGQVVFANKVGAQVDAPVFGDGLLNPTIVRPGPLFSAQLFLQSSDGSRTPLLPISTFNSPGTGAAAIADRYWRSQTVDVPGVQPGTAATFVVGVWRTSVGSYEAAKSSAFDFGESQPFSVTVGGGILPPSNLTTLQTFNVRAFITPEPSTLVLSGLGAGLLVLARRCRR